VQACATDPEQPVRCKQPVCADVIESTPPRLLAILLAPFNSISGRFRSGETPKPFNTRIQSH